MRAISFLLFISALMICFSQCDENDQSKNMQSDRQKLEEQFNEILTLAQSAQCTDSADWSYMA